jgi:16S rRNA C1402 (ribose-2'-O) methylase RsmI
LLEILSGELAPNKAAKVAAKITGLPKRQLYELLMGKK